MEEALSGEEPMPKVSSLPWLRKLLLLHTMFAHLNFRDLRKMLNLPTTGPDPQCLYCAQTKLKRHPQPKVSAKRSQTQGHRFHLDIFLRWASHGKWQ